ncbi:MULTISPECIES: DUF2867 domain-containing protein [Pseudomonas]|jgi:hypothetical protein|uniref:DUF2867 domain-containing protein n=1 Tax=Pseudomonas TaxID=286 RepID=UPI0001F31F21|nr:MULTISPECIES: DUF2867 domain-containing protein [Pseudomonas]ADR62232.1 Hypothetical protein, conserved [Pseudomonas putida BIRD-1]AOX11322.1 hypothetical protein Q5O_23995 [Pseudomonas putida JB]MCI1022865.1 DUF2867 domain-containing protein [Pseudomonas putida]MDN4513946.1 DUF2867 domain-containing protein [Pseudomonas sp. 2,4-D]MDW2778588.1 DUF2867 domain-containing protein [Pseudomonas sp. BEA3.1]
MSAQLVAAPAELDFLHCDSVHIAATMTALQAYCAMTSDVPGWLAQAFRLRDFISRRFNVTAIHGFSSRSPERVPVVGEHLDFFRVEAISDQQLVLTSRDTHLAVMVSVDLDDQGEGCQRLSVTTSVQCFNTFGRLYMLPVGKAHGPIVRRMLRNI